MVKALRRSAPALTAATVAVAVVGITLLISRDHVVKFGFFTHPPIYGKWLPTFASWGWAAVAAAVVLAGLAWALTSWRRAPTWLVLSLLIGAGVAASAMVNLVRGDPEFLVRGISTGPDSTYYTADLHLIGSLGVREFIEQHPDLVNGFRSWSNRTHPPGVLVFLHGLFTMFGRGNPMMISTAIAVCGMAAAVPAWAMGRVFGDEQAGRFAAALFVAAPGPLLLAYTALDVVFATAITTATALFMVAISRRSVAWSAGAGAVLAATTFLTYATVFIALAVTIAVIVQTSRQVALKLLGAAGAAGVAVLLCERIVLGYDVMGSYLVVPGDPRPYDPYWIVGAPTAVLLFAGIPLALLGLGGMFASRERLLKQILPVTLTVIMLIWFALPSTLTHLRPGEVERTWAFMYPVLAASAGYLLARWSGRRWAGPILALLVIVSVGQAIWLQSLWDTIF